MNEQADQKIPLMSDQQTWSEADLAWLEGLPQGMQITAKRYGKALFQLVMQAGTAAYALSLIGRRTRGNREMEKALGVLQQVLEGLIDQGVKGQGRTREEFLSCREDLERLAALSAGADRPPGGILLAN